MLLAPHRQWQDAGQVFLQLRYALEEMDMPNQEWTFPEEPWYDNNYMAVKFAAVCGDQRHVCAISRAAINDTFRTEDSREQALANYQAHSDRVHRVAIRLIQEQRHHPEGFYLITSQEAQEFGL